MSSTARVSPKAEGAHWVYLDDKRTHEVHAEVRRQEGRGLLVTTEFPAGDRDPASAIQVKAPFDDGWEVRVQLAELEQRLSLLGRYWRARVNDASRWARVQAPPKPDGLKLAAHDLPLGSAQRPDARLALHHFHSGPGENDRFLLTMPRLDRPAGGYVLADLSFPYPDVDAGDLDILHDRVPAVIARSAVVRENLEFPKRGYEKLVEARDYVVAYGQDWRMDLREAFGKATHRLMEGRTGPGAKASDATQAIPETSMQRIQEALRDPNLGSLVARYVTPADAKTLTQGNEITIRRWVARRRRLSSHHDQHALSVVEAYLLTRYGLADRRLDLMKAEAGKVLRYVDGFA